MAGNIGPPLINHQGIPLHQQQLPHSQMPHPSTSGKSPIIIIIDIPIGPSIQFVSLNRQDITSAEWSWWCRINSSCTTIITISRTTSRTTTMDTRIKTKTMDTFPWTTVCINSTAWVVTITGTFKTSMHCFQLKENWKLHFLNSFRKCFADNRDTTNNSSTWEEAVRKITTTKCNPSNSTTTQTVVKR